MAEGNESALFMKGIWVATPRQTTLRGANRRAVHKGAGNPSSLAREDGASSVGGRRGTSAASGLQVRLKIGVVANLLVDLQPIALAVGDDDAVALRVEIDRGREAEPPLRLEALNPPARLHHVGVGVDALLAPLRQFVRVADQRRDRAALGIEHTDPMVAPIADIDVAVAVDRDIGRMVELVDRKST